MSSDPYSVGTASVANGGTTVTGTGTFWVGKVRKNDMFFVPGQGLQARVTADPTSNTELAITAWAGADLTDDAYEIIPAADSTTNTARLRDLLAEMSVVQANGRGLFFRFSDTTTDDDPGAGFVRLNNADLTLVTEAYIDVLDANGASVAGEIDTWDDSTSLNKGKLWLRSIADPASFRAYWVAGAVVDGTGYRKLTLEYIGGSGSFAADDELMVAFGATGDTGEGYVTDATVADPSELAALEGEDAGYLVFVTDLETEFGAYAGRSGVVRLIAGPDWEVVALYTGPQGAASTVPGPTGPVGVDWKGDYDAGTAYVENDGVLYNGSSWRALGATTGNAPPTLPTTSNAYWQLLARQGTDGAGTVNSVAAGAGIAVDNTDPTAPIVNVVAFTGDSGSGGTLGGVPAPAAGDGALKKILNASGQWVLPPPEPNLLMNPDFAINQRGFTSGGSAVNTRTFDRWLVWSGGQTVTFNSDMNRVVTIGAGVLFYQMIRAEQNEGGQHVLNWEGTATAEVRIGATWTAVTKGTPFTLTANQLIGVRFGPGTLSKPKLEKGSFSTPYVKPNRELSLDACKAYYQVARAFILFTAAAGNYVYVSVFLGTVMRATPTVAESVISADVNLSGRSIDELSPYGCRIYGTATNSGNVGMWRQLAFDAEITA